MSLKREVTFLLGNPENQPNKEVAILYLKNMDQVLGGCESVTESYQWGPVQGGEEKQVYWRDS